ncbi:MAG: DNA-3-methyladenine glycosylase family protein [Coriobacteriia bacterium]
MTARFRYRADDAPSRALAAADSAMAELIAEVGCVEAHAIAGGRLQVLVRGIVGQQLSDLAGRAIYERVAQRIGLSAEALTDAPVESYREAGLSRQKARYIREIARAVLTHEIDLDSLDDLDDETVIRELSRLPGVGRWTAEMFLLFALDRPDVLAADDRGVQRAAGLLLGFGRPLSAEELREVGERWRPYRSAATMYLQRYGRQEGAEACEG